MEIQVLSPTQAQPLPPVEWNYTEVKQWLEDGLARYRGVVYDATQIAQAKADRATLNKLAAAIDAKRQEMKKLYLQPYADFEAQAKELTAMIKAQSGEIDAQVKAFDEQRKKEKLEQIKEAIYTPMIGDLAKLVPYERLHDPKWLNVTCSASTIGTELAGKIDRIFSGLDAIDKMGLSPEMAERIKGVFLKNFDLAAAIAEKDRIEKEQAALAEYEAKKRASQAEQNTLVAEQTAHNPEQKYTPPEAAAPMVERQSADRTDETIHTVVFRIRVTTAQLNGLGAFMRANNIKPERVQL